MFDTYLHQYALAMGVGDSTKADSLKQAIALANAIRTCKHGFSITLLPDYVYQVTKNAPLMQKLVFETKARHESVWRPIADRLLTEDIGVVIEIPNQQVGLSAQASVASKGILTRVFDQDGKWYITITRFKRKR